MYKYRIFRTANMSEFIDVSAKTIGFDYHTGSLVGYGEATNVVTLDGEEKPDNILWFFTVPFGFVKLGAESGIMEDNSPSTCPTCYLEEK